MPRVTEVRDSRASTRALWRRLWGAIKRYRGMVLAMFGFAILEALFTKAPLLLVQPLIYVLGKKDDLGPLPDPTPSAFGDFTGWFRGLSHDVIGSLGLNLGHPGMEVVAMCGLIAILCGLVGSITIYFVQTFSRFFAIRIVADLRTELANHFLQLPLRFYGRQRMGEMISKVTNDTQVMQRSFELAADNLILDPLLIAGNVAIIAWNVPQALLILVVMVPVMTIQLYRQGSKVRKRSSKTLQAMGEATESLNQILSGIRTVKAFQLEAVRYGEFERNTVTFLDRTKRMLRAKGRSLAQTFVSYQFGFAALLVLLGYVVLVKENGPNFAAVSAILAPLTTTYQNVKRLTRSYHVLMESASALDGVEQILHAEIDHSHRGGRPMPSVRGDVELRDVWFAYEEEPVLRGLSLKVRAGQTIALVGESGGGKSTTMDLLMRFYDPQRGSILVDGHDLREIALADFRAHTAVVSQQAFLFNTTIRENIAYGKPGATQAEIEAAAKAANIHDFIVSQPQGYDTLAGERGCNLSGGQMQRITIARAIIRDPAILFLDEATSALDSASEEIVQAALDNLRRGRTSFVIAHRLSTIVDADLIVVLEGGRIVETGTHAQLLARGGVYKRMHELQSA